MFIGSIRQPCHVVRYFIGNREWKSRRGVVNTEQNECIQSVPVFSNAEEVQLFVNNKSLGKEKDGRVIMLCLMCRSLMGENQLEAVAVAGDTKLHDMLRIQFQLVCSQLKDKIPFTEINVMLGSPRYFEDRIANVAWIPEQEYKPGSWGFVGGTSYRRKRGSVLCLVRILTFGYGYESSFSDSACWNKVF